MNSKILLATTLAALLSTVAIAQGYGPGAGNPGAGNCGAGGTSAACGYGGGYGAGPGSGYGHGRGMRGGGLMTPEEMSAHRDAMHNLKSVDECQAYLEQHRAAMAQRAQELGITPGPGPRTDMCEGMAARGFFR